MVTFNDVTLRDGHQSLLAGRMRQEDLLKIARPLARSGFETLEVWGGTTYDIPIRFKGEDPWDNLRQLSEAIRTEAQDADVKPPKLSMLLRGQNLVGYKQYPDDVVEAFITHAAKNGIEVFRIFDALNDVRNLEASINAVQKLKAQGFRVQAQGTICYTKSPVHSIDRFVTMGRQLAAKGCDSICIKDMAGLLEAEDARALVTALKTALPDMKLVLHMHAGMGKSDSAIRAAIEAGVDSIETASLGLSGGSGHSATETTLKWLQQKHPERAPHLDEAALHETRTLLREIRPKYSKFEIPYRPKWERIIQDAQVPGGMLTTLENQLATQTKGLERAEFENILEAVIREIPKVREDFGYVPLVTPTSQIIGAQAVNNTLYTFNALRERFGRVPSAMEIASFMENEPETYRYKILSQESVLLLTGHYGKLPTEPERGVYVLAQQRAALMDEDKRPADGLEPEMEKACAKLAALEEEGLNSIDMEGDALTLAMWGNVGERFLRYRSHFGESDAYLKPEKVPEYPAYEHFPKTGVKSPQDTAQAILPVVEKRLQQDLEWLRLNSGFIHLPKDERIARMCELEEKRQRFGTEINVALHEAGFTMTQCVGAVRNINKIISDYYKERGCDPIPEITMDAFKSGSFGAREELRADPQWAQGAT